MGAPGSRRVSSGCRWPAHKIVAGIFLLRDGRMITKEVAEEVLLQMGPEKVAEFRAKLEASTNK